MGLILRYATAPTDIESGTVYDCGKLAFSPTTLLINITDQVYEYKYKREISQHNISPHQGNAILEKVRLLSGRIFLFQVQIIVSYMSCHIEYIHMHI